MRSLFSLTMLLYLFLGMSQCIQMSCYLEPKQPGSEVALKASVVNTLNMVCQRVKAWAGEQCMLGQHVSSHAYHICYIPSVYWSELLECVQCLFTVAAQVIFTVFWFMYWTQKRENGKVVKKDYLSYSPCFLFGNYSSDNIVGAKLIV